MTLDEYLAEACRGPTRELLTVFADDLEAWANWEGPPPGELWKVKKPWTTTNGCSVRESG